MSTYNGNWIPELNELTPLSTDPKSEGDDAFQEIKRTLKNTFPNFVATESFDGSAADLNALVNGDVLPRDSVIMWYGTETDEPGGGPVGGWTICDGRSRGSGGGNAPDLRGKFIAGAQSDRDSNLFPYVGTEAGDNTCTVTGTTDGHALTITEMPAHTHNVNNIAVDANQSVEGGGVRRSIVEDDVTTTSRGGNAPHSHTFTGTGSNIPAFTGVMFIIKD